MATVGGGYFVSDALVFGIPDQKTQSFFENKINQIRGTNHLMGFSENMLSMCKKVADTISIENIKETSKKIIKKIDNFLRPNIVNELRRLEDFQVAGPMMQRFIMANPVVRQRYHEQRLDGYSDSYVDYEPNKIGEEHTDYRLVMSGIQQIDNDGNSYSVDYYQNLDTDDLTLSSMDKFDILSSWINIENILAEEVYDPTSPWGDEL